jgi:hypothetical protein
LTPRRGFSKLGPGQYSLDYVHRNQHLGCSSRYLGLRFSIGTTKSGLSGAFGMKRSMHHLRNTPIRRSPSSRPVFVKSFSNSLQDVRACVLTYLVHEYKPILANCRTNVRSGVEQLPVFLTKFIKLVVRLIPYVGCSLKASALCTCDAKISVMKILAPYILEETSLPLQQVEIWTTLLQRRL